MISLVGGVFSPLRHLIGYLVRASAGKFALKRAVVGVGAEIFQVSSALGVFCLLPAAPHACPPHNMAGWYGSSPGRSGVFLFGRHPNTRRRSKTYVCVGGDHPPRQQGPSSFLSTRMVRLVRDERTAGAGGHYWRRSGGPGGCLLPSSFPACCRAGLCSARLGSECWWCLAEPVVGAPPGVGAPGSRPGRYGSAWNQLRYC